MVNIFVAKMSSMTTGDDLATLFGEHGTVVSAKVIIDRDTKRSKCFGFVEMKDELEGLNAIDALHNTEFHGHRIVVKKAEAGVKRSNQRPLPHSGRKRSYMK